METKTEGNHYHRMYSQASEYYQSVVSRWGRYLTPKRVEAILDAHGFTSKELLEDSHDNIVSGDTLPERLDAALLFAWLGY